MWNKHISWWRQFQKRAIALDLRVEQYDIRAPGGRPAIFNKTPVWGFVKYGGWTAVVTADGRGRPSLLNGGCRRRGFGVFLHRLGARLFFDGRSFAALVASLYCGYTPAIAV